MTTPNQLVCILIEEMRIKAGISQNQLVRELHIGKQTYGKIKKAS